MFIALGPKKHDTKDSIFLRYIDQATVYSHAVVWNVLFPKITDDDTLKLNLFVLGTTAPPVGQGLFIHEVSRSHTTTHHSR